MRRQHHHAGKGLKNTTRFRQVYSPAASSAETAPTAGRIPESGTPTLERPGYTSLHTLPNQTLTPGATTVPGNAGGIAPASNDASSGEYTPSEGYSAPTAPGGNPSETQGVPTFSSAAQPADANLPHTLPPPRRTRRLSHPAAKVGITLAEDKANTNKFIPVKEKRAALTTRRSLFRLETRV
jgi:hypothetical protein